MNEIIRWKVYAGADMLNCGIVNFYIFSTGKLLGRVPSWSG